MNKLPLILISAAAIFACSKDQVKSWHKYQLPDAYLNSHILKIEAKGNTILVGTFGQGALFSDGGGGSWTSFDTSNGLSWNFILGGDWNKDYLILATLGDGLNISTDYGKTWERYGYNFFGIEYLYTVGAKIVGDTKFVPSADGLVIFENIQDWRAITENKGIGSQYIFDMVIKDERIALGTLHGFSMSRDGGESWMNFSPDGIFTAEELPACKVRAVEFDVETLYAGCDDGLYISSDGGNRWIKPVEGMGTDGHIRDLLIDSGRILWVATYSGVVSYDLNNKTWKTYGEKDGLPGGGINCLAATGEGEILAGTNFGMYSQVSGPAKPKPAIIAETEFADFEQSLHQWMLRPVRPTDQNLKDQTYLYGSTMGGNFRQHQGNEYNAPEGTPLRAVDDGIIVYIDREIGHSVLKCDRRQGEFFVYAHYHHQNEVYKSVGDRVKRGDIIGSIGKRGNVTNEHLHFEVSLSKIDDSNKESHTRNPELWVETLPGTGTIVGIIEDENGNPVPGARIYGVTKPVPTESPFSFAESYQDKVHPDELYGENFVIGDVPEGEYLLFSGKDPGSGAVKVLVKAGMVTRVKLKADSRTEPGDKAVI